MQKHLQLAVVMLFSSSAMVAQNTTSQQPTKPLDENAFTFTEAQLGEDDNMTQNVTILNSATNTYASEVGYLFSPVRFRYRAFRSIMKSTLTVLLLTMLNADSSASRL